VDNGPNSPITVQCTTRAYALDGLGLVNAPNLTIFIYICSINSLAPLTLTLCEFTMHLIIGTPIRLYITQRGDVF